jgi:acyl-CoA synthetase (AMP-forming)/AMP-acid ligase II
MFVEAIMRHAEQRPAKQAFAYVADSGTDRLSRTYAQLDHEARTFAAFFAESDLAGSRVLIALPSGPEFIAAFLGCLYGDVTAVPVAPLRKGDRRSLLRIDRIAINCGACAVITTPEMVLANQEARLPSLFVTALKWIAPPDAREPLAGRSRCQPFNPAFLQYTSGSTTDPKGVVISHANLVANVRAIQIKFQVEEDSRPVSWLPLHHDMGLIGVLLAGLYCGNSLLLMSPLHFIQRPIRWLRAISEFGGTHSGAPNFAYDLCVKSMADHDTETLSLSSWKFAFCGSEPVRANTLEKFARKLNARGFDEKSFYPCYGLAESTLLVSGNDGRAGARTTAYDARAMAAGRAIKAEPRSPSVNLVSCGSPTSGHQIAIVNPDTREPLADGEVGEIWIQGPSVSAGYWNPEANEATNFDATMSDGKGQFCRTGDLGFVDAGELYIVGRCKDLVILHGRNIYPQDVEHASQNTITSATLGGASAFSAGSGDSPQLVLVQELQRLGSETVNSLIRKVIRSVAIETEVRPDRIVIVGPNAIPRTTSGKVRRTETRAMLERGDIGVVADSSPNGSIADEQE